MTGSELDQLDELIAIAREDNSPLTFREKDFVESLGHQRGQPLSAAQGEWFDRLARTHLMTVRDRD